MNLESIVLKNLIIHKYLLDVIPDDDNWEPDNTFVINAVMELNVRGIKVTEAEVWKEMKRCIAFDYKKYNGYEDVLKGEYVFQSEKDAEEFWKTSSILAPPERFQLRNGEYRWAVSYM